MSSVRSQRLFFRRLGEALSPYQLIESFLKLYIARAHMKIERLLAGRVPFHYSDSEYENAPLERLVTLFQRYSNNKALVKRLREATKTRNYIAHRVIGDYMEHHERDPKTAQRISRELKKIEEDGYALFEEVHDEMRKVYGPEEFLRELFEAPRKA